jgi:pyruvate/2-oxoglutarate/acetoin dehydrogenase E1 component
MEPTNQKEFGQEVAKLSRVIQIDEGKIQAHLGEAVRRTVEETLNTMLDAEVDRCAGPSVTSAREARKDTRAGSLPATIGRPSRRSEPESSEAALVNKVVFEG